MRLQGHLCPGLCQRPGPLGLLALEQVAAQQGGGQAGGASPTWLVVERPVPGRCPAGLGSGLPALCAAWQPLQAGSSAQALSQVTPAAVEACSGNLQGQGTLCGREPEVAFSARPPSEHSCPRPPESCKTQAERGVRYLAAPRHRCPLQPQRGRWHRVPPAPRQAVGAALRSTTWRVGKALAAHA